MADLPKIIGGPRTWTGSRDADGWRTYKIKHIVKVTRLQGPQIAMDCPGLPQPNSMWIFDDDFDVSATCGYEVDIRPLHKDNDPNEFFEVEHTFSNKPRDKCINEIVDNPLLLPPKISANFIKHKLEATHDRFGEPILNSAFEQFRGANVEFDESTVTVKIEQNVGGFQQGYLYPWLFMDNVNAKEIWGNAPRCVKLSGATIERLLWGNDCSVYYKRTLEFEINTKTFDRDILDEGTKALHGQNLNGRWIIRNYSDSTVPDPLNPNHFDHYKDAAQQNARCILDGNGVPIERAVPVMSCAACPLGAPRYWNITRAPVGQPGLISTKLEYVGSGCGWAGKDTTQQPSLDDAFLFVNAGGNWEFYSDFLVPTYVHFPLQLNPFTGLPNGAWNCNGFNALINQNDFSDAMQVYGSPVKAGKKRVQKYNEVDFFSYFVLPANFN